MDGDSGTLPRQPLAWGPAPRLPQKTTIPSWYAEIVQTRPFVRRLASWPGCSQEFEGLSLLSILRENGISCEAQIGHFARTQALQTQRIERFILHAQTAVEQGFHISSGAQIGHRPLCAACGSPGPVSNTFRWLSSACSCGYGFDPSPTLSTLRANLRSGEPHRVRLVSHP